MNEILKEINQHCLEMQKMAETKNAGLIAFNGAIALTVIKLLTDDTLICYVNYYLYFVIICSLISIFLNLSAFSAQLIHKELNIKTHKSDNLLYFGTASLYTPEEYLKTIKIKYKIDEEITDYHKDQARQIVINSQIALRKFKLFNSAFKWTIAGILTPFSVIISYLFFNNNE